MTLQTFIAKSPATPVTAAWLNRLDISTQERLLESVTVTGTVNAILLTVPLAGAEFVLTSGSIFTFIPSGTNTGAVTINGAAVINELGNPCTGGEFSVPARVRYNGTQWQLVNPTITAGLARTASEIAALVTPTNTFYTASPSGYTNVLRYFSASMLADFLAGTHSVDMTSAFNSACATGKKVWCPNGNYLVTNIDITATGNIYFEGESGGSNPGAVLYVGTNNQGAFRHNIANDLFFINIKNFSIRAQSGVTGARGYLQTNKSFYSANCMFENVTTYADLAVGYDGNFISSDWIRCTDGYSGTPTTHQAANSISAAAGHPSNNNVFDRCRFFQSKGVNAAVEFDFGSGLWFKNCHWENHDCRAVLAKGQLGGGIKGGWMENIRAISTVRFENSVTVVQGCRAWEIEGVSIDLTAATSTDCFEFSGATGVSVHDLAVRGIPAANVLCASVSAGSLAYMANVQAISGAGAATFLGTLPRVERGVFTGTFTGLVGSPTGTVYYSRNMDSVLLFVPSITGTSNAVSFTMTGLPASLIPARTQGAVTMSVQDNGGARAFGQCAMDNTGVLAILTGAGSGAWTNVNAKSADRFNYPFITS